MSSIKLFCFIFFIIFSRSVNSQVNDIFISKYNNKKVKIIDNNLSNTIDSFINVIKNQDRSFNKKGYITIKYIDTKNDKNPTLNKFEKCIYISYSFMQFFLTEDYSSFPTYYAFHKKKLILLFNDDNKKRIDFDQNELTNKKKFIRIINKYIEKPKFLILKDSNNKKEKFRNIGRHGFGAGFYVCYLIGDSIKSVIIKPSFY